MWKKRFLPYSMDDKMTSPDAKKPPLAELQAMREEIQQQPIRELPPAAHQNSHHRLTSVVPTPPRPAEQHWTKVPVVQQVIPVMQANPINHIQQQQIMYEMDMYRAQKMFEMQHYLSMSGMYSMAGSSMPPTTPLHRPEMMDEASMQRFQHERYLQQARDMQMADMQAEQEQKWQKMVAGQEKAKDGGRQEEGGSGVIPDADGKRRTSYKAVMKNGELVEAENGYLIVTHNIMTHNAQVVTPKTPSVVNDSPLNLSMKEQKTHYYVPHSDTDSGYTFSPQPNQDINTAVNLVKRVPEKIKVETSDVAIIKSPSPVSKIIKLLPKIAPKPSPRKMQAVQPKDEVLKEDAKEFPAAAASSSSSTHDGDLKTMFPLLKTTNTGSLVLWNFLWALLQDENHKKIVSWISFPDLKFCIVNPSMLATVWGQVKQNPSMDWEKIKKILDLYLRKNLISSGPTELEFTFLIVPKAIKETLGSMKKC